MLSALLGIAAQRATTTIDPVTKTVYGKIKIRVANNTYDELINNEDTTPRVYKYHGSSIQHVVDIMRLMKRSCETRKRFTPVQVSKWVVLILT